MAVAIREYDVPYYRMRALYRRLRALARHVEGREGVSLSYSSSSSVAAKTLGFFFESFRYRMEHVRLEDGIQPGDMRILAVINRKRKDMLPLSRDAEDEEGNPLPIVLGGWLDEDNVLLRHDEDGGVSDRLSERWNTLLADSPRCSCCGRLIGEGRETYLVTDGDGGSLVEVGPCCLSKYANGLPSRHAACYASIVGHMVAYSTENAIERLPLEAELLQADRVIAYALSQIDGDGYPVAHTRAYDAASRDREWLTGATASDAETARLSTARQRICEAEEAWHWAEGGMRGIADTGWARHVTCLANESKWGLIEKRDYGAVAAIAIPWHRLIVSRKLVRDSKWINPGGSRWVGEPGEDIVARVVGAYPLMRRMRSVRGMTLPHTTWGFLTDDGDILIWHTFSKGVPEGISQDNPMTLTAKVHSHDEYEGTRQTVVKRCRIIGASAG